MELICIVLCRNIKDIEKQQQMLDLIVVVRYFLIVRKSREVYKTFNLFDNVNQFVGSLCLFSSNKVLQTYTHFYGVLLLWCKLVLSQWS